MRESAGLVDEFPNLESLLVIPLFGETPARIEQPKPIEKQITPVVQSKLTIELLGTAVSGEESAAIIAMSTGSAQRVFFIGDIIQQGVKLHKIEPWAIVVDRAGKLERISLEKGAKLTATPMPVKAPAGNPVAASPVAIQRQMSRGRVQQQLNDLPTLLSQARVVPNYTNGKPDGFVISEIAQGSLYQQAGLQNGDVILKVNGHAGDQYSEQAMSMYQKLQNAAAIDLELMRAGQMKQVHYDIR